MMIPTTNGGLWPSRLAYTAALTFTLASTGTNLLYGWAKGTDLGTSLVWAAVSAGVSIVFALSWPALLSSLDQRQWSRAAMVLVAMALTGTYSVTAALGSAMGGRTTASLEEKAIGDDRAKAQAAYDASQTELKALPSSRPIGELKALIAAPPRPKCTVRVESGQRQTTCTNPVLAALNAELGRAERKQELEGRLQKASQTLSETKTVKVANSDAVALTAYLQGLGVDVEVDRLNNLLVLLAVLCIECGGGLSLAVGMSLQSAATLQSVQVSGSGRELSGDASSEASGEMPNVSAQVSCLQGNQLEALRPQHATATNKSLAHLLAFLKKHGGVLIGGQRRMAELLGWSKSWTHLVLHELAKAGHVQLSTDSKRTVVRLVSA